MKEIRFTVVEKTPAGWAAWIASISDRAQLQQFIEIALTDSWKAGWQAGNDAPKGARPPWDSEPPKAPPPPDHDQQGNGTMSNANLKTTAFGTASLGAVIDALNAAPANADVMFDFCYLRPTTVDSYRGYYDHLALGWSDEPVVDSAGKFVDHWPKARAVAATLEGAIGNTFEGWKGGSYRMDRDTPLWVANPGHTGGTGIIGVDAGELSVVLITAKVD